jgi:hypothetical protein
MKHLFQPEDLHHSFNAVIQLIVTALLVCQDNYEQIHEYFQLFPGLPIFENAFKFEHFK